jgi:hypothetical protein
MAKTAVYKSKPMLLAVAISLFSVLAGSVVLISSNRANTSMEIRSLPSANEEILSTLNSFLSSPNSVEQKLYQRDNGDAYTYAQGYLDLRAGCSYNISITGSLYLVDLISDGVNLWQRSTKRETGSQGNWEEALPLTSNINSPLIGLTGNSSKIYCDLRDIARVLVPKQGGGWDVDREALATLLAQRRTGELTKMYLLAGKLASEAPSISPSMIDVGSSLTGLDRIMIEQPSEFQLKILFIGEGEMLIDEITLSHVSEQKVAIPSSVEQRGDRTEEARLLLGIVD